MTKSVEAGEMAKRFEEYLEDVQAGNELLVTRGQTPIARLVPLEGKPAPGKRTIQDLKPLPGQWIGERVLRSGDMAEEMFRRE